MTEFDPIKAELKDTLARLNIRGILFDLDDTLIHSSEIFLECKAEYVVKVAEETGLPVEDILNTLNKIDIEQFKVMGVNPLRWDATIAKLAQVFEEHGEVFLENIEILKDIYKKLPRMRTGAIATLTALNGAGVKLGLVTHANTQWTYRKMDLLGLWNFFETVVIVNENGHKGVEDWNLAMENLGLLPKECLIIGDSLRGDVIPGDSLEARTIWLSNGSDWSVYKSGSLPERTVVLGEIQELLPALAGLR